MYCKVTWSILIQNRVRRSVKNRVSDRMSDKIAKGMDAD